LITSVFSDDASGKDANKNRATAAGRAASEYVSPVNFMTGTVFAPTYEQCSAQLSSYVFIIAKNRG